MNIIVHQPLWEIVTVVNETPNKSHQTENQCYTPFVLLAKAQTLTQNPLRIACSCGER